MLAGRGEVVIFRYLGLTSSGATRWFETHSRALLDEDGPESILRRDMTAGASTGALTTIASTASPNTLTRTGEQTGVGLGSFLFGDGSVGAVPSEAVTVGEFSWMHRHLRLPPRAAIDVGDYRYLYDLAWYEAERIPGGGTFVADARTTSR